MQPVEMTSQLSEVTAPPRWRGRRFWILLGLVLVVLWIVGLVGLFLYWTDNDLRQAMAEADRDSPGGWRIADIEAQREQIPDEENAALVVLRVKKLLPAAWPLEVSEPKETDDSGNGSGDTPLSWDDLLHSVPPEVQLDGFLTDKLRASLARIEPARAEARKLARLSRGRFPIQWQDNIFMTTLMSQDARGVANLLGYEAELAAQEGHTDRAMAAVRGIVGSARSVGDEPFLISMLIRIACDAQAISVLERVLAQGEPSAAELTQMQALLEKEAAEPMVVWAMRGERASLHEFLLSLRSGKTSLAAIAGGARGLEKTLLDVSAPTLARRSHGSTLQLMNEFVAAVKLPPEKQRPVLAALEMRIRKARAQFDIVTALVMPAITKVAEAYARNLGKFRCAFVALALERYRRDHGRWPSALHDLVPAYLAAVPTDPQDGQPLRYMQRPDGVIVYSIGPDGTDDGGKLARNSPPLQGTDQGFQLWNVEQRRQAARENLPLPMEENEP